MLFSEPKIPQLLEEERDVLRCTGFSALQRAENSSKCCRSENAENVKKFQCSSASRKFLKLNPLRARQCGYRFSALQRAENSSTIARLHVSPYGLSFSALQRAENSSIRSRLPLSRAPPSVSVLFSEPKIPQLALAIRARGKSGIVSVLFSEPKIPQSDARAGYPM